MRVEVLWEYGYGPALFGLGLSYGLTSDYYFFETEWREQISERLCRVSKRCAKKGNGEEKFLRMIQIWADVTAPRFWWSEFDTYKVGTVALSESTMHTLGKRPLTPEDFEPPMNQRPEGLINNPLAAAILASMSQSRLEGLNRTMTSPFTPIEVKKAALPEGFLQRRIVNLNYAVLANMIRQRRKHKLPQWRQFLTEMRAGLVNPELLPEIEEEEKK